jgi:protein-S-isoprenylcysteine O-methyltransferase Ste14
MRSRGDGLGAPLVAALFVAFAATNAHSTVGAFRTAFHAAGLDSWALAANAAVKTAVVVTFAVFVLLRPASRRPSREPVAFVACVTALAAVVVLRRPSDSTSAGLIVAGDIVATVAFCWVLWSALALGRCFGILPEARGLVTAGPYKLVRHPVYLGELTAVTGLAIAAPTGWNIGVLAAFVAAQAVRMRLEERALTDAFPEYVAYAAETPRLVPRLSIRSGARA